MSLKISPREVSNVSILDIDGRIVLGQEIGALRDAVRGLVAQGTKKIILNLAKVDYIDSSGLGQLVSIWTSIKNRSGHMTLLNPTKRVGKLLQITKLNTLFEILEVEPEAVKRAGGSAT